ncbi:putative tetratricopeptide-like helical domain-containing protein [Rosa chinensis]|uniref:Putative tetratricopeptide-like helical domain-containing protein n=1 Tax=Rosa chinensis TaxID=74649 RepID=A0A2P6RTU0_ROSCH|nr:putative tetratricopeptide-like helical domain-containing protein [Rosa chinensis]
MILRKLRIFGEWESQCKMYDFRVLNRLLIVYCKMGLLDKAESLVNKAVEGRIPYASTWHVLVIGFMENKQIPRAVEMLKNALSVGRFGWMPNPATFTAFLDYLEWKGDVESNGRDDNSVKQIGSGVQGFVSETVED